MSLRIGAKIFNSFGLTRLRKQTILMTNIRHISQKDHKKSDELNVSLDPNSAKELSKLSLTTKVMLKDQNGNVLGIKSMTESKLLAKKMKMNLIEEKKYFKNKYKELKMVSNQYLAQMDSELNVDTKDESLSSQTDVQNNEPKKRTLLDKSAKEVKRMVFSAKLDENDLMTKLKQIKRWLSRGHTIAVSVTNTVKDSIVLERIYNKFENELKGFAKLNQKKIKSDSSLKFMIVSISDSNEQLNADKSEDRTSTGIDIENLDPNRLLSDEFAQELEESDKK